MSTKRVVTITAAIAALTGGAVGAVAATKSDDAKKTEDAILSDAAKRLNVSPGDLRSALSKAEDAQLDQAVKDGKLTQAQADEIKKERDREGRVLGIPPGGPHGPHGFRGHFFGGAGGPGGPGFAPGGPGVGRGFGPPDMLGTAAKALGLSQSDLFKQLQAGKSLSDIAKAKGKSVADVERAVKAAIAKRLDADVKAGRLTDKQRDEMLSHLDIRIGRLGEFQLRRLGPGPPPILRGFRGRLPVPKPPPGFRRFRGGPPVPMPPPGYPPAY